MFAVVSCLPSLHHSSFLFFQILFSSLSFIIPLLPSLFSPYSSLHYLLVSSHLISSHLISSHLISSHLFCSLIPSSLFRCPRAFHLNCIPPGARFSGATSCVVCPEHPLDPMPDRDVTRYSVSSPPLPYLLLLSLLLLLFHSFLFFLLVLTLLHFTFPFLHLFLSSSTTPPLPLPFIFHSSSSPPTLTLHSFPSFNPSTDYQRLKQEGVQS